MSAHFLVSAGSSSSTRSECACDRKCNCTSDTQVNSFFLQLHHFLPPFSLSSLSILFSIPPASPLGQTQLLGGEGETSKWKEREREKERKRESCLACLSLRLHLLLPLLLLFFANQLTGNEKGREMDYEKVSDLRGKEKEKGERERERKRFRQSRREVREEKKKIGK